MTEEPPPARRRLDPDRAAATRRARRHSTPQVVDTRRYRWTIYVFGLMLVAIISITFLFSHRPGSAGIPAGQRLPLFAAPLAASTFDGAANLHPRCTTATHDPRALNVCLLVKRAPLVLAFFVTSYSGCEQEVSAMQTVADRLQAGRLQFAAIAVNSSHHDALHAVRAHHWSIPVGYDVDGRIGEAYGFAVCPLVELVQRGGVVARRLIGERWASAATLEPQLRVLLRSSGAGG